MYAWTDDKVSSVLQKALNVWQWQWWHLVFHLPMSAARSWTADLVQVGNRSTLAQLLGLTFAFRLGGIVHVSESYTPWADM